MSREERSASRPGPDLEPPGAGAALALGRQGAPPNTTLAQRRRAAAKRRKVVIKLRAQGLSLQAIADRLGVAYTTVQSDAATMRAPQPERVTCRNGTKRTVTTNAAAEIRAYLAEAREDGAPFDFAWAGAIAAALRRGRFASATDRENWTVALDFARPEFQAAYEGRNPSPSLQAALEALRDVLAA